MSTAALDWAAADGIFFALGDATRRSIVRMVSEGPQSVSALAKALGVTLTAIAQHVQVLQGCGLLRTEKVGRVRLCQADPRGLDVLQQWVSTTRQRWEARFDALDAMLDEED